MGAAYVRSRFVLVLGIMIPITISHFGCIGASTGDDDLTAASSIERRSFPLDTLDTSTVSVKDQTFRVWVADTPAVRTEGLMHVPESEIADDQGMLFIFGYEQYLGFWMRNTVTSLDIAFARLDGTIVATHTMPPLTLQTFPSYEPAIFALEVKAGTFARLGIEAGDRLDVPDELFKP